MRREEFRVGMVFRFGSQRWRCTGLGARVVVAVCLEPGEEEEHLFHEYDLPACTADEPAA